LKVALETSNELEVLVKNKNVYLECGNSGGVTNYKIFGGNWLFLKKKT
jgi:hypothetical protein